MMRAIDTSDYVPLAVIPDPGPCGELRFVPVAQLLVNEAYQRPITKVGRASIRKIAQGFLWRNFAPCIVVWSVELEAYVLVDGQHRATAARLAGQTEVPAYVIVADTAEQAHSFAAINGQVTRMAPLYLHRAAVAAGEANAVAVEAVCARAGVSICRYPIPTLKQEPGQTMAIEAVKACIQRHGADVVVLALRSVTETRNNIRGGLLHAIIVALCEVIGAQADLKAAPDRTIAAMDRINLIREWARAASSEREPGQSIAAQLVIRLRKALTPPPRVAASA